jgi:hypothetical protein
MMEKILTVGGDAVDFGVRPTSPVKHIIGRVKVASAENKAIAL